MKISESEIERVRENLRRQGVMTKLLSETLEFQEQSRLFKTWMALCNVPPNIRCPVCGVGHLAFSCGHGDIKGALTIAKEMVQEHSKETKRAREEIEEKHPELELIPVPR